MHAQHREMFPSSTRDFILNTLVLLSLVKTNERQNKNKKLFWPFTIRPSEHTFLPMPMKESFHKNVNADERCWGGAAKQNW
jgi:hypothetical protein